VSGSYLHFKGLEIANVPMNMFSNNGVSVGGSAAYDIFESLNTHHNAGNGSSSANKSGGGHLILNSDAHDNYDPNSNQGIGTERGRLRPSTTRRRARRSSAAAAPGGTRTTATI